MYLEHAENPFRLAELKNNSFEITGRITRFTVFGELKVIVLDAGLYMQIPKKYEKAVSGLSIGDHIYLRAKYEDTYEDRVYFRVHKQPKKLPVAAGN